VEDHFQAFLRILPLHSLFGIESTSLDSSLQQKGGVGAGRGRCFSFTYSSKYIILWGKAIPEKFNHSLLFMGHVIVERTIEIGYSSECV
jgi:hypothetical protein